MTRNPKVFPIPFCIDITTDSNSMPSVIPIRRETMIKEIKALNLNLTIRRKRTRIPRITISNGMVDFSHGTHLMGSLN